VLVGKVYELQMLLRELSRFVILLGELGLMKIICAIVTDVLVVVADCHLLPLLLFVFLELRQHCQQQAFLWQPETWLMLQMLMTFWEEFYQHKISQD
nr:hypothetical protein [Tanacetum cinerariifolium]